ncbi:MAG: sarcosine oxidase subunit delta [Pseudoprimorskyibacter sp.]|nr:sarcosine oxidase subunit delta [Pseudoprimorskyibacter sp.]
MRIRCPFCGERGLEEFSPKGDAAPTRPALSNKDPEAWHSFVHLRENPKGQHREYFQHSGGCRAWLIVTRDTRTHNILDVTLARQEKR